MDALSKWTEQATTLAREWYPKIDAALGIAPPAGASPIKIVMDVAYDGVAATSGSEIRVSAKYVHAHPKDIGLVVHELTHAIQGYPKYDPVWLVEGIADWVRFFCYEPVEARPHPSPAKANARASYRTTAAFLEWARNTYDTNLVKKLNAALSKGTYSEGVWNELTGSSLDELNTKWIATLKSS